MHPLLIPSRVQLASPRNWIVLLSLSASLTVLGQNDPSPVPNDPPAPDRGQLRDRASNRPTPPPQPDHSPSQPASGERDELRNRSREDQAQRRPDFDRAPQGAPTRGPERIQPVERSRHIRAAIRHLHAAGLHDQAERLEASLNSRRLAFQNRDRNQNQNPPAQRQRPDPERNRDVNRNSNEQPELARRLETLQREVQELRRSLESQRSRPDRSNRPPNQGEQPR